MKTLFFLIVPLILQSTETGAKATTPLSPA
jgi:hypothetical protein